MTAQAVARRSAPLAVQFVVAVAAAHGQLPVDMTEANVKAAIAEHDIGSVAAFVAALPGLHKRHFITLYESASPAAGIVDKDSPRVVSWGADARFILAWTQDGPEQVEFIARGDDAWTAGIIDFGEDPPKFSHPATCATCHGSLNRPIWGADQFVGTASSTEDLLYPLAPDDEMALRRYVASTDHPRLAPLDRRGYRGARYSRSSTVGIRLPGGDQATPNWNFAGQLNLRHGQVLFNRLKARPDYEAELLKALTHKWGWPMKLLEKFFTKAEHDLATLADGTEVMGGYHNLVGSTYKGYDGGSGTVPTVMAFLALNDLRKRNVSVELLYRYTSNSRFMTGVSPGLADSLLLFGRGKGSAEQEMLAAIDEYFETPGSGYIRLAQRRFRHLAYNNALISHHVWGFRGLVQSADKLTSVSLEATSSPVPEGTSTPVTVRLYKALGHDATIPLTEASTSYVKLPKSVVVPAGSLSATATLETIADGDWLHDEVVVSLGSPLPEKALAGDPRSVTVGILDSDPPPVTLSLSSTRVKEGGSVKVTATVGRSQSAPIAIPLVATPGTAESNDWSLWSHIVLRAGKTEGSAWLTTRADADGDDETLTVKLGALPAALVAGRPDRVELTIVDKPPAVSLTAAPNPVEEGAPTTIEARLTKTLGTAVTIPLVVTRGTAEAGDFSAPAGIEIPAGETEASASMSTVADEDDDVETLTVALGALPSPVEAGSPASVSVTISDTTAAAILDVAPNPVTEGGTATVTVTLTRAPKDAVTIPLTFAAGTAETTDYEAPAPSSVTIPGGRKSASTTLATAVDPDAENETLTVALGALPKPLQRGTPNAVEVTIADATKPAASLSVQPSTVTEGSAATVTVTLTARLSAPVTIPLDLTSDDAESGDYAAPSSLTVPAGGLTAAETIATANDADGDDETLTVALGPLPASLSRGSPTSIAMAIRDTGVKTDPDGGPPPAPGPPPGATPAPGP
ncbi:MAG: hypothetical protein OXU63_14275, partial [Acidobacteriota bacterium]|nr:hypothetical protein [Acidobacteriota bacterium]